MFDYKRMNFDTLLAEFQAKGNIQEKNVALNFEILKMHFFISLVKKVRLL